VGLFAAQAILTAPERALPEFGDEEAEGGERRFVLKLSMRR
jgi:hypothetical protein